MVFFQREHAHIKIDEPEGSFSKVDVDKVDLQKYPGLADVPWYKAAMEPGDCLFIPYRYGNSDNNNSNSNNRKTTATTMATTEQQQQQYDYSINLLLFFFF